MTAPVEMPHFLEFEDHHPDIFKRSTINNYNVFCAYRMWYLRRQVHSCSPDGKPETSFASLSKLCASDWKAIPVGVKKWLKDRLLAARPVPPVDHKSASSEPEEPKKKVENRGVVVEDPVVVSTASSSCTGSCVHAFRVSWDEHCRQYGVKMRVASITPLTTMDTAQRVVDMSHLKLDDHPKKTTNHRRCFSSADHATKAMMDDEEDDGLFSTAAPVVVGDEEDDEEDEDGIKSQTGEFQGEDDEEEDEDNMDGPRSGASSDNDDYTDSEILEDDLANDAPMTFED